MTITRDDLEGKLREIEDVVVETEDEAKRSIRLYVVGATVIVVAIVAYSMWRSSRRRIHVEVYQTV